MRIYCIIYCMIINTISLYMVQVSRGRNPLTMVVSVFLPLLPHAMHKYAHSSPEVFGLFICCTVLELIVTSFDLAASCTMQSSRIISFALIVRTYFGAAYPRASFTVAFIKLLNDVSNNAFAAEVILLFNLLVILICQRSLVPPSPTPLLVSNTVISFSSRFQVYKIHPSPSLHGKYHCKKGFFRYKAISNT